MLSLFCLHSCHSGVYPMIQQWGYVSECRISVNLSYAVWDYYYVEYAQCNMIVHTTYVKDGGPGGGILYILSWPSVKMARACVQ
jgi:hypothetical protein